MAREAHGQRDADAFEVEGHSTKAMCQEPSTEDTGELPGGPSACRTRVLHLET